ncbi:hypothetical protein [Lignipirellula cremea]|uniref:Leucine Rich repeats (2 copies) n=1 Tax=Lignipirellula cremea TaxID=2528010 RepID=A0A518DSV2_9BACT|nr:hypothetical protein [Lignipirellula cremea]QDU94921.1 Leucine Rich repeats (2 copies) [Lignipirellula cremea]
MNDSPDAIAALEQQGAQLRRSKKGSVLIVDLRGCISPVTDDTLLHVAQLPRTRELYLEGTKITDAGLQTLAELAGLHTLDLQRTPISDASWPLFQSLPALRLLLLAGTNVTRPALQAARPRMLEVRIVLP